MRKRTRRGERWNCRGGMKNDHFQPISDVLLDFRVEIFQPGGSMQLDPEDPNSPSHLRVSLSASSCIFLSGSSTPR